MSRKEQMTVTGSVCTLFESIRIAAEVATGVSCRWKHFEVELSKDTTPSLSGTIFVGAREVQVLYGMQDHENEFSFRFGEIEDPNGVSYHARFADNIARVAPMLDNSSFRRHDGAPMVRCGTSAEHRWQRELFNDKAPIEPIPFGQ